MKLEELSGPHFKSHQNAKQGTFVNPSDSFIALNHRKNKTLKNDDYRGERRMLNRSSHPFLDEEKLDRNLNRSFREMKMISSAPKGAKCMATT